jgi:hypothetical protein
MKSTRNTHAVLGIDPGGTTGVAAGYVELKDTRRATLATMHNNKTAEVDGDYLEQSVALANIMSRFVFTANVEYSIPIDNIHIAIEDFILRRRMEGGATGNLTSCWVAAGAVALFAAQTVIDINNKMWWRLPEDGWDIAWQQPSNAKTLATDARLKSYGLWTPGSTHKRDATRHLVLRVDKLIT